MSIGYHYKNWRIASGVEYLTSGYQMNNLVLNPDPAGYKTGQDKYKMTYGHLAIPLQVGYSIFPHRKLSVVPYLGVLVSYNLSAKTYAKIDDGEQTIKWSKEDFDNVYNRISVWGSAALYLEYRLATRISLYGGPSLKYMFSNMGKEQSNIPAAYQLKQRNQAMTIDLGVNIKL